MSETMICQMMQKAVPVKDIPSLSDYSHDTIGGWVRKGRRAFSGRVVKLEAIRHPKSWYSTPEAVARFFAALAEEREMVAV